MNLIEVKDKKSKKEFLEVARIIYKDDNIWVCPPDKTIEGIFDPAKNVFFRNGEACRWILKDEKGNLIGRVAAFINKNKAFNFDPPTGGMGFFECVNDKDAAFMLFDQCKEWLSERKIEAMDGPINFGENDNFWGLLVEGFTHPSYGMNYNFPYYKDLFEAYGFTSYFDQVSNHLNLRVPFPERFWKIADWIRKKPAYRYEHFTFAKAEKYIMDLKHIYDTTWVFHENFTPINADDLRARLKKVKQAVVEEFIWFVYHDEEPIAFLFMLPDVNQILKHLNGSMNLWAKLKFLYYKSRKTMTRARIVIMGVVPNFQKSGVESAIFWHLDQVLTKQYPEYHEVELSWVGDFNPKMRKLHESVGAVFAKNHLTYRKFFDEEREKTRSTIIPMDTKEKFVKGEK
ncbi:MAG: hypothetical protein K8S00_06240 [Bacteroidales bacterium]|nr:hypothetical protein [Bacteroidales bacterium]